MREGCALQHALRSVIAGRRGSCSWDVDYAGWVVTRYPSQEQAFLRPLSRGRSGLAPGVTDSAEAGDRVVPGLSPQRAFPRGDRNLLSNNRR